MTRAFVLATLALALAADRAYPCMLKPLSDRPLTPDGTLIPSGGGVVITSAFGSDPDDEKLAIFGGGLLMAGTANVEAAREYIAPALTVIVAKPQANRSIELVDERGRKRLGFLQGGVVPRHAAPKLAKVHSNLARLDPAARFAVVSQYTIELAEPPPADVLALVIRTGGRGIAWARPQQGRTVYAFYAGGKRCLPGPAPLVQGEKVSVAWLDVGGRLSLESKDFEVGALLPEAR